MEYEKAMIEALRRGKFSFGGGGGSVPNGFSAGGRLGYTVPVGDGGVDLGVAGGGVYSKNFKGAQAQNVDAQYRKGDHALGVEWRRESPGGIAEGQAHPGNPNQLWLKYRKAF